MNIEKIKDQFPILKQKNRGKPLVYFDNAATSLKPLSVIDSESDFYKNYYGSIHRSVYELGEKATNAFEGTRNKVAQFIGTKDSSSIIFTKGATEAINLVADAWGHTNLSKGDIVLLTEMEHHSNIVPWHYLREHKGAVIKWVRVNDDGSFDMEDYKNLLGPKTKFVALTQMSNALGTITPMKEIIRLAHEHDAPVLVDGCQGAVHLETDVQGLDCDFYVLSGHKLYGPSGIGALYGKADYLNKMRPYRGGGEMIREVTLDNVTYGDLPHKFEAGTPPILEVIGLGAALRYIESYGHKEIAAHEHDLLEYATRQMTEINNLSIMGTAPEKGSVISFTIKDIHPHDLATVIDRSGVAVRAGHHCAQPLMKRFGVTATARASFAMYKTRDEIDSLVESIHKAISFFG
jgi:cysteine desulfurase/selenocysteine lyase